MLIEVEDESTWPKEILSIFIEHHETLENYSHWESSQYDLLHRDLLSYVPHHERPSNPYQGKRNYILEDINNLIHDSLVIGYHCTRLLKHEIEDINKNGLALPSTIFLRKRLQTAVELGHFTQDEMQQLIAQNAYLEQPIRENVLHFVCGYSALKNDSGIQKFFRCWGGEAIFNEHENQTALFPKLCQIGIPYIIKVKLEQKSGINLAERLESTYLYNRNKIEILDAAYDDYIRIPLPRKQILEIIPFNDPDFIKLTAHHEWDDRYAILTNPEFY